MILKANETHIPLIVRRIGEFKKVSPESIRMLLADPKEVIYVDETLKIVCRIQVKEKENQVIWLIPANSGFIDLYYVMTKALIDIYQNFPEARDKRTWARFADNRGCTYVFKSNVAKELTNAWHLLFPKSSKVQYRLWDNSWIIYGNHGEIVRDLLSYLNKPKEVMYEPTAINL